MGKFRSKYDHPISETVLAEFWQQVGETSLTLADGHTMSYCFIEHPNHNKVVVISNGRVESYLKYMEVIYDLYQQGFSVYAADHVGQGLSSRLATNTHMGHIDSFERYVAHLGQFINEIVLPQQHSQRYLLGHSMGCAIAALYLEHQHHHFSAAAFCAPMFGIKLPLPKPWVEWLANRLNCYAPGKEPNYILGGQDYHAKPFYGNPLTHSRQRYARLLALYQQVPQIQLGSPTNQWLVEAIPAAERALQAAKQLPIPTLILQAGKDCVVDNDSQWRVRGPHTQLQQIADARHEILIEHDYCRSKGLKLILDWFNIGN
ncbi:alpha/beta fold hydrolase [Shewanella avicenniae]|uniref:Alpha/beta fold hydrolase n=1 Tax=Shewanella avicenniae TaxID=2814294 RepID=A0ABX7QRU6_9GAMM|nr:alpha/beta fold hydrolase [Shewanella avicenniae]QSX33645.1 alpha/beta fold hydrolase [Shewanella avicenniae]